MKRSLAEIKEIYSSFPADIDTLAVENGNKVQRAWHAEKLEATVSAIAAANLKHGAKILDLACGSGPLTLKLAKKFPEFVFFGSDFNEKAIGIADANAKKHGIKNASFSSSPAEQLSFNGNFFDAVIALDALDHFLEPKKALEEMHRVSKKNALLVLAVGNYFSLWPLLEVLWDKLGKGRNYLETHLTHFKKHSLKKIVESAGFKETSIITLHNFRPMLAVLTSKYSRHLEFSSSKRCFGMTLFLTACK